MDLDRRQFLKLGMAASASVAASGAFGALGYALSGRHVSRTTSSYHAWTDTACRMCETGCGIRAFHDKYGNLVTLAGISDHPVNKGKICAKGMAAINLHYHPERLLTPLFADKGRGKGFDSITYEDALKKAADMIRQAKAQNALFVVDTQDEDPEVYATLFRMLGVDYKILSRPILKRRKRQIVDNDVYGSPNINPAFSKSGAILAVGANPFEGGPAHLPLVRQIAKARVAYNSQLIVLDPCNTNTAGKADLWLPILPGTDALAMIQLLRICNQFSDNKPDLPRGITQQDVFRITGLTQDQFAKAADLLMSKDFLTILASDWIYSQPHAKATRYWLKQLASIKDKNSEQHFYKYHRGDKDPDCLAVYEGSVDEHYKNWFTQDRPVLLITRKSNPIYGGQADTLLPSLKKDKKVLAHISICPFGNETN